jgi:hypothetical protein
LNPLCALEQSNGNRTPLLNFAEAECRSKMPRVGGGSWRLGDRFPTESAGLVSTMIVNATLHDLHRVNFKGN